MPRRKRFLSDVKDGIVPETIWEHTEVGNTQEAKKEIVSFLPEEVSDVFITPKPVRLIRRILQIASDRDSIVLDSFAGSGTTGHAVLAQNSIDGGTRKFLLVEMDKQIARSVIVERLAQVTNGQIVQRSNGAEQIYGLGGGFRYAELGPAVFDANGQIQSSVGFSDLARHVFYLETGTPVSAAPSGRSPLIAVANGTAIYLLYNGVLGDQRDESGNVLTSAILASLPEHAGPKVIFADGCRIGADRLKREGITFRQIPYDVRGI